MRRSRPASAEIARAGGLCLTGTGSPVRVYRDCGCVLTAKAVPMKRSRPVSAQPPTPVNGGYSQRRLALFTGNGFTRQGLRGRGVSPTAKAVPMKRSRPASAGSSTRILRVGRGRMPLLRGAWASLLCVQAELTAPPRPLAAPLWGGRSADSRRGTATQTPAPRPTAIPPR